MGNQSLADVATKADEARNQSEYRKTASWHFLNIPIGLNFQTFIQPVKSQQNENNYTAIIKCEQQLADANTTIDYLKAAYIGFKMLSSG